MRSSPRRRRLLARTRDLRLIVLLAKLSILNRDLNGFAGYLTAICTLLETQWSTVHPRDEDGDFTYRAVTIESLDVLPTVVNPLQFQPLIESRRFGTVTYRAYQTATGRNRGHRRRPTSIWRPSSASWLKPISTS